MKLVMSQQELNVSMMVVAGRSGPVTGVASGGRAYRTVSDWAMKMCTVSMLGSVHSTGGR